MQYLLSADEYSQLSLRPTLKQSESVKLELETAKSKIFQLEAQRDHYADMLRRVSACFTRDDDLPDGLLAEIDKAVGVAA